jgi:hypothetical protein
MNIQESRAAWKAYGPTLAEKGIVFMEPVHGFATDELKRNYALALDAQPVLSTSANAGIPALLTTYIDPEVVNIAFAALKAAEILGERKTGDWLTETAMFPVVEATGEVTTYGDYNQTGSTGVNTNWPQRQSYHFQTMVRYGEREMERAGLARINWVSSLNKAAAMVLNRYSNYTYFYGVAGLQNYGLLNDPNLPASLTPGTKANYGTSGSNGWITSGGAINATANEVYADFQSLFYQLVSQTLGLVKEDDKLVLALSPQSAVALTITNSFGVNVMELIKAQFPNVRIEKATQYAMRSSINPEGVAAGNYIQLIAEEIEGEGTGYAAFTEKLRMHKLIPDTSSFKQKATSGSWGFVLKKPLAVASMVGV